ncbi:protein FAM3A isoform X2 [Microtus pennsylvanicus]|uniref:protein FAM3A isoform X2 n=1 Tax=Microtus pennsylvanicus TaxID=10058 RepID=UPI003F6A61E5
MGLWRSGAYGLWPSLGRHCRACQACLRDSFASPRRPNETTGKFPDPIPRSLNSAPAGGPNPAGEVDMRLAGPLRIVALIITMGLTWILVTILLGGPGGGLPRIQQFFTSPENSVTAGVSGELLEARAFDMWAGDVNDLLKFIRPLHEGTLVFVASYDDPATKMNEETRKLFSELGSRNAKELAFRDSWVFVGAKGVQNKSPFEQHVKNSKHTNKYEGWPEALEMEGCIPRRSMAG